MLYGHGLPDWAAAMEDLATGVVTIAVNYADMSFAFDVDKFDTAARDRTYAEMNRLVEEQRKVWSVTSTLQEA